MNLNFYIIRHGESEGNVIKDVIGQSPDTNLTKVGEEQASALAKRFLTDKISPDYIFCSTYPRAIQTAEIVKKDMQLDKEIIYSSSLVEYSPGDFRGKSRSKLYSKPEVISSMLNQTMGFPFPGGDTLHQIQRKISSFVEDNILYNKDFIKLNNDKKTNIFLFSHGITIKCFLQYVLNFDRSFLWKMTISNTGVCRLKYTDQEGWKVKFINDCSHWKK